MNRKEDTIQLLRYLIDQYENNPELEDIRLAQLLSDVIPDGIRLYYMEANEIQKKIDTFLKEVKTK